MGEVYYNSNGVILKDNKVLFSQTIPQVGDTYGGGIVILGGITGLTAMPDDIGGYVSSGWDCLEQMDFKK